MSVPEDELMRGHERQVRLDDLSEIDRRRLMHERIRQAESARDELVAELVEERADHDDTMKRAQESWRKADEWAQKAEALRRGLAAAIALLDADTFDRAEIDPLRDLVNGGGLCAKDAAA